MNKPEINVTPLIDVLLVLLIIFMVVTPMKPSSFNARIPTEQKTDEPVDPHPDTILVSYETSGAIRINREIPQYSLSNPKPLSDRLSEIFTERDQNANLERTVFIKAPTDLDYGSVAMLIDTIKAGRADPISLQIDGLDGT